VTVGLIASDLRQNILTEKPDDTLRLLSEYSTRIEQLAAQGAKVVIAPEKIGVILDSNLPAVDALFGDASRRTGAAILVGLIRVSPAAKWNEARLYSADKVELYEKHHMLPAYESEFVVGTRRLLLDQASGRWGITICKDMDFPHLSRQYSGDAAGLLLVPAWDFNVDGWLHGRMAIVRGVESGFSIARAPKQGILTVTDNRGRVLAERVTGDAPFATLLASVPVLHETTLYARWGDWFAWLNLAILAIALFQTFRPMPLSAA
jgi:apolipoprotein N-acyltransferase